MDSNTFPRGRLLSQKGEPLQLRSLFFFFSVGPEAQESVMEEGAKSSPLSRALGGDTAGREERVVSQR